MYLALFLDVQTLQATQASTFQMQCEEIRQVSITLKRSMELGNYFEKL